MGIWTRRVPRAPDQGRAETDDRSAQIEAQRRLVEQAQAAERDSVDGVQDEAIRLLHSTEISARIAETVRRNGFTERFRASIEQGRTP